MKQVRFQLRDCGEARRDDGRRNNGNSGSVEFNRYAILGNFLLAISVLAEPEPSKDSKMIRELFIAFVMLIITVAATAGLNGGPQVSVQQVEASLAR